MTDRQRRVCWTCAVVITLVLAGAAWMLARTAVASSGPSDPNVLVTTDNAITGVTGGSILATLWMLLRKVGEFFGRMITHFDTVEKLQTASAASTAASAASASTMCGAVLRMADYVDLLKREREIDERAEKRIRENTPVHGIPVAAMRAAIERGPRGDNTR